VKLSRRRGEIHRGQLPVASVHMTVLGESLGFGQSENQRHPCLVRFVPDGIFRNSGAFYNRMNVSCGTFDQFPICKIFYPHPVGVYLVDIDEDELAATLQNVEEALVDDHPDVFVIEVIEQATCNDQTNIIERFVAQCSNDVTLYDLVGDFCRGKTVVANSRASRSRSFM